MRSPTVRDVARLAGVSPSTVSLVMTGKGRVRPETAERVRNAAAELGYRPSGVGAAFNGCTVESVAILYTPWVHSSGQVSELCRLWINGIREVFLQTGAHMSLFAGLDHVSKDHLFQQQVKAREVEGVIVIGHLPSYGYVEWLLTQAIPLVLLNRRPRHHEFSYVGMDNYGGAVQAMDYAASLGHRKVAVVYPGDDMDAYAPGREAGVKTGLAKNSLELVYEARIAEEATEQMLDRVAEDILAAGATAVQAYGDPLAVQLVDAWERAGRKVPEDISVVGFDDLGYQTQSGKRVSSIGFDKHRMGCLAGEMLLKLIQDRATVSNLSHTVKTFVADHDTSGPVRT